MHIHLIFSFLFLSSQRNHLEIQSKNLLMIDFQSYYVPTLIFTNISIPSAPLQVMEGLFFELDDSL